MPQQSICNFLGIVLQKESVFPWKTPKCFWKWIFAFEENILENSHKDVENLTGICYDMRVRKRGWRLASVEIVLHTDTYSIPKKLQMLCCGITLKLLTNKKTPGKDPSTRTFPKRSVFIPAKAGLPSYAQPAPGCWHTEPCKQCRPVPSFDSKGNRHCAPLNSGSAGTYSLGYTGRQCTPHGLPAVA